jgi:hypothetical protein
VAGIEGSNFMNCSVLNNKWLMRTFAAFSTLYGFWFIFSMDVYLPWQVRFAKGVEMTAMGHFALWLATFEIRGLIRYVVASILFISLFGLFFLWGTLPMLVALPVWGYGSWIFFRLVKGNNYAPHR